MDYEKPPESEWNLTLIAIVVVIFGFVIFTALTDKPEEQAIEAIGETAYQLSR
jgi:sugar phosphate permease